MLRGRGAQHDPPFLPPSSSRVGHGEKGARAEAVRDEVHQVAAVAGRVGVQRSEAAAEAGGSITGREGRLPVPLPSSPPLAHRL